MPDTKSFWLLSEPPAEDQVLTISQRLQHSSPQANLIFFLIKQVWSEQEKDINAALRRHGLTLSSFVSLFLLYRTKSNRLRPSHLSDMAGECRTNMTRICNRLERLQLIRRTFSEKDRRSIDLELTDAGRDKVKALLPQIQKKMETLFNSLDATEQEQLSDMLCKLLSTTKKITSSHTTNI